MYNCDSCQHLYFFYSRDVLKKWPNMYLKWKIHFSYNSLRWTLPWVKTTTPQFWKVWSNNQMDISNVHHCNQLQNIYRIQKIPREGDTPNFRHFSFLKNGYFLAQNTKYILFVSVSLALSIKFLVPFRPFLNLFGAKTPLLSLVGENFSHLKWTRSFLAKQIPPKKSGKFRQ